MTRTTDAFGSRRFKAERYEGGNRLSGNAEERRARMEATDGSERLFDALSRPIERLARKHGRSFDDAAVMAHNGVGGY